MTAAIYHTLLRVALENYSNNRCTSGKMQGHHHSLDTRASEKPEIQNLSKAHGYTKLPDHNSADANNQSEKACKRP